MPAKRRVTSRLFGLACVLLSQWIAASRRQHCDGLTNCEGVEMEDGSTLLQTKVRYEDLTEDATNDSVFKRPFDLSKLNVKLPKNYTGKTPLPLIIMLHGTGNTAEAYLKDYGLQGRIDTDKFIQIVPPGRMDLGGSRFGFRQRYWQAWGSRCGYCGYSAEKPYPCHKLCGDRDVDYMRDIIYAATRNFNVDTKRIYINGHSDGASLAYRMACDASDVVTAVFALAGSPPEDNWKPGYVCKPTEPVSVLHIHGTYDDDTYYAGGQEEEHYKGAVDSVEMFANLNECPKLSDKQGVQLTANNWTANHWLPKTASSWTSSYAGYLRFIGWFFRLIGWESGAAPKTLRLGCGTYENENDTEVFQSSGCKDGTNVELWKLVGYRHNPCFTPESMGGSYQNHAVSWLLDHRKAVAPKIRAPACLDTIIGWEDSDLDRCDKYAQENWCTEDGGYGGGWKTSKKANSAWFSSSVYRFEDFASSGHTALTACCACGGGVKV